MLAMCNANDAFVRAIRSQPPLARFLSCETFRERLDAQDGRGSEGSIRCRGRSMS